MEKVGQARARKRVFHVGTTWSARGFPRAARAGAGEREGARRS
jgi:hypothetical protein